MRPFRIPLERGLGESGSQPDGEIVRRVLDGEAELFGVLVVDGARWIVPPGALETGDDFGGEVGLLIVPEA